MLKVNQLNGFGARRAALVEIPVYESVTVSESGSTPMSVSMPATRPDDDLYVCMLITTRDNGSHTVPGTWNEILVNVGGSNDPSVGLWYWWGSSEPATYSITKPSGNTDAVVVRISGLTAGGNPIEDSATANQEVLASTYTASAVTPETNQSLVLNFAAPYIADYCTIDVGTVQSTGRSWALATNTPNNAGVSFAPVWTPSNTSANGQQFPSVSIGPE